MHLPVAKKQIVPVITRPERRSARKRRAERNVYFRLSLYLYKIIEFFERR